MSRKRTVASILNDDASSSSTNQPSEEIKIVTRKRTKVRCFCSKCNGKLVDPRTKKAHEQKDSTSLETSDEQLTSLPIDTNFSNETNEVPQVLVEEFDSLLVQSLDPMTADDIYSTPIFDYNEPNFNFRPRKKGVKKSTFRHVESIDDDNAEDDESILSDYLTEDDDSDESSTQSDEGSSNNDEFLNDFEDYSHPTFDFPNTSKLPKEDQFT
jgi:hypothetical protein